VDVPASVVVDAADINDRCDDVDDDVREIEIAIKLVFDLDVTSLPRLLVFTIILWHT